MCKPDILKNIFRAILAICFFSFSHIAYPIEELDGIVAIVNDDVITKSELDLRTDDYAKQLKINTSSATELHALKRQVLERMIKNKIQLQKAQQLGITIDDITLNRMLEKLASSNDMSLEQLISTLKEEGIAFDRFREQTRNELIIKQLQQRLVSSKVTVSDQEINQFVMENLKQEADNAKYHLLHILVATPESAHPEDIQKSKNKADKLYARVMKGEDFKTLAINESDGRMALQGGDLGWRTANELPESFVTSVKQMKIGETAQPIQSASGFHLLKLVDKSSSKNVVVQTHARHILIRTGPTVSDNDARNQLTDLKKRIQAGEDFAQLANKYSEDPGSKNQGGDLGWANPGSFVAEFEDVMNSLDINEVSEPFRSQFGWHIIQVLARRNQDVTRANIETQAKQVISQRKAEEELRLWLRRIRDEAYVEYIDKTWVESE